MDMNNTVPVLQQVIDLFEERSSKNMPGIEVLNRMTPMPTALLQRLYDRVASCPVIELDIIQRVVVSVGMVTPARLAAYLDNFDVALQIVRAQVIDIEDDEAYSTALRDLIVNFTKLGMDTLRDYSLTKERSDLHCARLLATGINIADHDFEIPHEYHVELEAIRADVDFLRTAVYEFYQVKWAFRYMTPVSELLKATHYASERGRESLERVTELIAERGNFDREVFDMILDTPARAVSVGIL